MARYAAGLEEKQLHTLFNHPSVAERDLPVRLQEVVGEDDQAPNGHRCPGDPKNDLVFVLHCLSPPFFAGDRLTQGYYGKPDANIGNGRRIQANIKK